MSLTHPTMPPCLALTSDADEVARRTRLVERYNCLVGEPKKITRTIQKQFVMGFMSQLEIESLRGLYQCVITAVETARHVLPAPPAPLSCSGLERPL